MSDKHAKCAQVAEYDTDRRRGCGERGVSEGEDDATRKRGLRQALKRGKNFMQQFVTWRNPRAAFIKR